MHVCVNLLIPIDATFLMWACFWHSLRDLKVDVAHPHFEIGSLSTSSSFGTLIKCMGGQVEWAGAAGNQKCPEFASCLQARRRRTSSTSTRVREISQGVTKKDSSFGSGSKLTFELFAP